MYLGEERPRKTKSMQPQSHRLQTEVRHKRRRRSIIRPEKWTRLPQLGPRRTIALSILLFGAIYQLVAQKTRRAISANLRAISREDTSRWNRYFNRHSSRFLEEEDRRDRRSDSCFVPLVSRVAGQRKINNALPRARLSPGVRGAALNFAY